MDAAERLLVDVGYASITTRRLAEEAELNHGLVHYYFGSMENVLAATLDRFTERLVERQRAMYSAPGPFIEKWRTAMSLMDVDQESGYQKVWLELHALAWNDPALRERVARVTAEWRAVIRSALEEAAREYGRDPRKVPITALTALVETFSLGTMVERHAGVTEGHRELLDEIERFLLSLEKGKGDARPATGRKRDRRT
ncbi:MAG: TetR/AcrR family transcriptional regulator [Actinomycetota bacterium]|nr:TetR/AcrR family transcriptional regulator [Actinomycetota bacterium]